MKKSIEMKQTLTGKLEDRRNALMKGDTETANALKTEIDNLKLAIQVQEELEAGEKIGAPAAPALSAEEKKSAKVAGQTIRAYMKMRSGKSLTEAENALLVPSETPGTNGESYIMPQYIVTRIQELKRSYRSARELVTVQNTNGCFTGSITYEAAEKTSGLINFDDGEELTDLGDPSFTTVKFSLSLWGGILTLSNVLLRFTDNDLAEYVARYMAKKSVITENELIFAALEKSKTAVAITGPDDLKKSLIVTIDPANSSGPDACIVTNQDGFAEMATWKDEQGRYLMQPDITQPEVYRLFGLEVKMYPNASMPSKVQSQENTPSTGQTTTTTTIPVLYGNTREGTTLFESGSYEMAASTHAGFTKNQTIMRIIQALDVQQTDASDKVYCYGTITNSEVTGAAAG